MRKDFKIIAIKPLENCNKSYLKVLSPIIYTLYNEYEIDELNDTVTYTQSVPIDLFAIDDININISAIVGKNGVGKSTLIELLLVAINNLTFKAKESRQIHTVALEFVNDINLEFYYLNDDLYKIVLNNDSVAFFKYNRTLNAFSNSRAINETVFDWQNFFYTIGTNYSQYALNSKEYGNWIHQLFHKNDAYQAPIVVNPYRYEGNIDINTETDLVKSRLLSLLLYPIQKKSNKNIRKLTDNQIADKLIFTLNLEKLEYVFDKSTIKNKYVNTKVSFEEFYEINSKKAILDQVYTIFKITNVKLDGILLDAIQAYIIKKIVNISRKYEHYLPYFEVFENKDADSWKIFDGVKVHANLKTYLELLLSDKSHITFKLRQALNFLQFNPFESFKPIIEKDNTPKYILSIDDLSLRLKNIIIDNPNLEVIELIPPAIFDSDIEFLPDLKIGKESSFFKDLSSGEKQLIYSSTSILYHLSNINSVSPDLINYKAINLIFEEIELYFHPDLQRRFVKFLLDRINDQNLPNIKAINLCFVTHSPFILSDIPSQNILFLELDTTTNKSSPQKQPLKTFGANVHDLLRSGFFMEDGFMGEFAKDKILEAIQYLEFQISLADKNKNEIVIIDYKAVEIKLLIDMIGERLIKNSLQDLYFKAFFRSESEIDKEIDRLINLKSKI